MRTSAWLKLVGIAGGVAAAVACSSSSTPTDKYPSVDSFCEAWVGAECQEAAYCEVDATACKAVRKPACLQLAATAAAQGRTYTPSKAPDCVDGATKTWSTNNVAPADVASLEATCERVFQGSIAKNAACTADLQCTGDAICDKGHCGEKVVKKSGDGCANIGEVCDTGFYCTGSPALCLPKKALSETCSDSTTAPVPCAETLHCVGGTCLSRGAIGAACASDTDCVTGFCDVYNGFKCGKAIVFAPAEAVLCSGYGGPQADAGSPAVIDAGSAADAASE